LVDCKNTTNRKLWKSGIFTTFIGGIKYYFCALKAGNYV